jgi:N-acetyl-anhydromuramyl-L-alanine amidase AmpD
MMKKQFYYQSFLIIFLIYLAFIFLLASNLQASFNKSSRWRYIVIHHSGTRTGSLEIFDKYHRRRGMRNGVAYHFVIDNGTAKKGDGQIEVGTRWKRQIEGGHCRQRWVNKIGVGICLVGNFDRSRPTKKQMDALVSLCKLLRGRYYIPITHIRGHGHIKGEKTNCPGKKFPLKKFQKMLLEEEEMSFKFSRDNRDK